MKTLEKKIAVSDDRGTFVADLADRTIVISYTANKDVLITTTKIVEIEPGLRERRYERLVISPLALVGLAEIANMVISEPKFIDMLIQQMEREGYEFPKPADNKGLEKEHQLRAYRIKP